MYYGRATAALPRQIHISNSDSGPGGGREIETRRSDRFSRKYTAAVISFTLPSLNASTAESIDRGKNWLEGVSSQSFLAATSSCNFVTISRQGFQRGSTKEARRVQSPKMQFQSRQGSRSGPATFFLRKK